jgi:hypothetical protein
MSLESADDIETHIDVLQEIDDYYESECDKEQPSCCCATTAGRRYLIATYP